MIYVSIPSAKEKKNERLTQLRVTSVYYTHGGHNGAMDKRDDKRNQLDRCNNNNGQAYPRIERELQPARIHYTALHCTHTHIITMR
jgi:hypothetical protein